MDKHFQTTQDFWSKIKKGQENDCWEWQGYKNPNGYGTTTWQGKACLSHRLAYYLNKNEIIRPRITIMHSCDNPTCCNPKHLGRGSQAANVRDAVRKGRANFSKGHKRSLGELNGSSKLTNIQILAIQIDRRDSRIIALEYKIDRSRVYQIKRKNRSIKVHVVEET